MPSRYFLTFHIHNISFIHHLLIIIILIIVYYMAFSVLLKIYPLFRGDRLVNSGAKCCYLDQVVQSIVSLTSSLRGQLVKCFKTL